MTNLRENQSDQTSWQLLKRILRENLKPYMGKIWLSIVCMILVAAASGLSAYIMKHVVDDVFVNRNEALLIPITLFVVGIMVVQGVASYFQTLLQSWVGMRITSNLQIRLFAHLMRMDLAFFHANSSGRLVSRFTNDVGLLRSITSTTLINLGKDLLSVIFLVGNMYYMDWRLAIIATVVFPLAIQPIRKISRRMRKVTVNTQEKTGELLTILDQSIQGIRMVKAYGMEEYEKKRLHLLVEEMFVMIYKAVRVRALSSPIMETLGGISIGLIIFYGGHRVIAGETSAGAFFSFITALLMAYRPLKSLANTHVGIQEGLAGAERLYTLFDLEPTLKEPDDAKVFVPGKGEVRFENVNFSYDGKKMALNNFSMVVPGGRKVALVGASGGGKTTVLNLVMRYYDPQTGSVLVDGQDVRSADLASLRANIALVSQEVALFDDTIRANIAFGKLDATDAEIEQAARNAAAHDFVMELPDGYNTFVGERGVKLSGGQRQRLSIARAMLKDAPILLLDEATSALDTESERQVQAALEVLMKGRTTIVVAHRLSTIVDADHIFVIENGKIMEGGSHSNLLMQNGKYAHLYALQFAENKNGEEGESDDEAEGIIGDKD